MMKHQHEQGIVLIITLWVIVVLSVTAVTFLRQVQLETKMVGFQRDTAIADQIAKAGLRQALVLLREDIIKDYGEDFQETIYSFRENDAYVYDGGNEAWADNPEYYLDVPFYENGERIGYYYVKVEDEASKFPINNEKTTIDQIQKLLQLTGVDEEEARSLAAALIDWRDPDFQVVEVTGRSFGRGDGANENSFYSGERKARENQIPSVVFKNAPIDSVDELLLIPGFTPEIVYGTVEPDQNQGRGSRSRQTRLRKGEYLGLQHFITVYDSRANMNTVKKEVLEALLYGPLAGEAESLAEEWVDYRDGRDRQTYTDDDQVMKTPDNSDMDEMHYTEARNWTNQVFASVQDFVQLQSKNFVVNCYAEYQGIYKGYRAVVQRWYIPWDRLPVFGFETNRYEDLEQAQFQIRVFEPIPQAKEDIDQML